MQHQRLTATILLTGLLAATAPAWAEQANEAAGSGAPVSDQQLRQFTLALAEIRSIRMEYMPQVQQAESREQRNELKQQGREEMLEAIRDTGLEVKEYNRIGQRIGGSEELKRRVQQMMRANDGG